MLDGGRSSSVPKDHKDHKDDRGDQKQKATDDSEKGKVTSEIIF